MLCHSGQGMQSCACLARVPLAGLQSVGLGKFGLCAHVVFCRVMDVIMSDKMDQALLKAAVALLKRCEPQLLQIHDMEDALHLLKLELPGSTWHRLHCFSLGPRVWCACCAG